MFTLWINYLSLRRKWKFDGNRNDIRIGEIYQS